MYDIVLNKKVDGNTYNPELDLPRARGIPSLNERNGDDA
jgi:hypothetical protein